MKKVLIVIEKKLNRLLEIADFGYFNIARNNIERPYKVFGLFDNSMLFCGQKKISEYNQILAAVHSFDKDIYETCSLKFVEEKIIHLLSRAHNKKIKIEEKEINNLFNEIKKLPIINFKILREIKGVDLSSPKPIKFGPFTIYNLKLHKKLLESEYKFLGDSTKWNWKFCTSDIQIGINIKAREQEFAFEKADSKFKEFENIIRYMHGSRNSNEHIGIFDYKGISKLEGLYITSEIALPRFSAEGAWNKVLIDDIYYRNNENGNAIIWDLFNKKSLNKFEKRIFQTIEWIGKAVDDTNDARSLIQFVFAIETLLKYNEQQTIQPSIMHNISESVAFLLGNDYESRKNCEKEIKEIYKHRSAIVHNGNSKITKTNVDNTFFFAKALVIRILTDKILIKMKSMKEFTEWLNRQKYDK